LAREVEIFLSSLTRFLSMSTERLKLATGLHGTTMLKSL